MAAHANLQLAAVNCFTDMAVQSLAGTLKTRIGTFITTISPSFTEQTKNDHPVLNWIAVLSGVQAEMDGAASDWVELRIAADRMYRHLFMAYQAQTQTPALITAAQATAILNAYNANFG